MNYSNIELMYAYSQSRQRELIQESEKARLLKRNKVRRRWQLPKFNLPVISLPKLKKTMISVW